MTESERAELQGYREQQCRRIIHELADVLHVAGNYPSTLDRTLFQAAFCRRISDLTALSVMKLRSAATLANCWWHWPEGASEEQKISLDEARRLHGD